MTRCTRFGVLALIVMLAVAAFRVHGQQMEMSRACTSEYANKNQVDYTISYSGRPKAVVEDANLSPVLSACVGIFSEPQHTLILSENLDDHGRFILPTLLAGKYRLVVGGAGFRPANAILDIRPSAKPSPLLHVHMIAGSVDDCSYIDTKLYAIP